MSTTLRECEGFQVFSPDGRLGVVERILYEDPGTDAAPAALAIPTALFGRDSVLLDAAEVCAVDVRRRRVAVPASPRVLARTALLHLREPREGIALERPARKAR